MTRYQLLASLGLLQRSFFCGLSKYDLNCSKNLVQGQCNSSSASQLNPNVLKNNDSLVCYCFGGDLAFTNGAFRERTVTEMSL